MIGHWEYNRPLSGSTNQYNEMSQGFWVLPKMCVGWFWGSWPWDWHRRPVGLHRTVWCRVRSPPENPLEMGELLWEIQWDFNVGAFDLRNIPIFGHFLMKCCHVLNFCDISKLGAVLRQVGLWSSLHLKRRCWGGDSSNGVGQLRANNHGNLRVTPPPCHLSWK